MTNTLRVAILAAIAALAVMALLAHGPVAQNPAYHDFADRRVLLRIVNLWDVATNLPFALAGLHGLLLLRRPLDQPLAPLRPAYTIYFCGLIVLAPASAWYHLDPNDATLLWDRLPITLVFMALFAAILGEHLGAGVGRRSLPLLLLLGVASIGWWRATGDLRLYLVVQFVPLLMLPAILLLFDSPLRGRGWVWALLGTYCLAKLFEHFDHEIYRAIGFSGHSAKHLAAALAAWLVAVRLHHLLGGRPALLPPRGDQPEAGPAA